MGQHVAYSAYNYAIYVFGTAFNAAFLLHVAAFSLSIYALALALAGMDIRDIARRFRRRTPARLIAAILGFLAAGLGGMWVFFCCGSPSPVHAQRRVCWSSCSPGCTCGYVLDLALLVPAYAAAAVLLWRHAAWGYVLAGVLLPFTVAAQLLDRFAIPVVGRRARGGGVRSAGGADHRRRSGRERAAVPKRSRHQ